jgi:hypothetical protein
MPRIKLSGDQATSGNEANGEKRYDYDLWLEDLFLPS